MKRISFVAAAFAVALSGQARAAHEGLAAEAVAAEEAPATQEDATVTLTVPPLLRYMDKDEAARAFKELGYALVLDLHYWDHAYQGRALKAGEGWSVVRIDPVTGDQLSANLYAKPSPDFD